MTKWKIVVKWLFYNIVEASCCFPIGQFLWAKSEVAAAVKEIITMFERQSGKKLKRMWSNLGMEFMKDLIDDFCKKNGVIHKTTMPYMLEQNTIVERAIAVAFEMVRCMYVALCWNGSMLLGWSLPLCHPHPKLLSDLCPLWYCPSWGLNRQEARCLPPSDFWFGHLSKYPK